MTIPQKDAPFTEKLIDELQLRPFCIASENGHSYSIQFIRSSIDFKFTIPIDIFEIFIDATDSNYSFTDWYDHYGPDRLTDYKLTLISIKNILLDKDQQFRIEGKKLKVLMDGNFVNWYP